MNNEWARVQGSGLQQQGPAVYRSVLLSPVCFTIVGRVAVKVPTTLDTNSCAAFASIFCPSPPLIQYKQFLKVDYEEDTPGVDFIPDCEFWGLNLHLQHLNMSEDRVKGNSKFWIRKTERPRGFV